MWFIDYVIEIFLINNSLTKVINKSFMATPLSVCDNPTIKLYKTNNMKLSRLLK